jgi:hypothetical protein
MSRPVRLTTESVHMGLMFTRVVKVLFETKESAGAYVA